MSMPDQEFLEKLKLNPELRNRFEKILAIAINDEVLIARADAAEEMVIGQMQSLGKETLQKWAESASARVSKNVQTQVKPANKHIKKKSIGGLHTD